MTNYDRKNAPNTRNNTKYEPGLVSVIIPTYNRAKHISKAIDSVLAQTYKSYEIIVIDDGSTDDTRQVLASYEGRIKYIYQENSGHAPARNTGIRAATGKWVAFLDSDDTWLPEKLSKQIEILISSNAKVCYTNVIWNSGEENIPSENHKFESKVFEEPFELLFFRSGHKVLSTLVVDRNILCRVGCFDERLKRHVDVRLCLRLAFETSFAYIDEPLAVFDRSPGLQRVSVDYNDGFAAYCGDAITRAEAYFQSVGKSGRIVKELRHQLGHYVSRMALCACDENHKYSTRRFAIDGLYFGGSWRTYRRCIAVLLLPWLVRKFGRNH